MSAYATKTALYSNLGIFLMKFGSALVTKSSGMMAEAFHSLADCGNQVLLLVGDKRAAVPESKDHAFGNGKEEYFWSFVVAVVLFSLGSVYAIYEGIHKLLHPSTFEYFSWGTTQVPLLYINLVILGSSFILEANSFRVALGESDVPFKTMLKNPDANLLVVLIEDFGALVGLGVVFLGTIASLITNNPLYDSLSCLVVGVIMAGLCFFLAHTMRDLLVGKSLTDVEINKIKSLLKSRSAVSRVGVARSMMTGSDSSLVMIEVDFINSMKDNDIEDEIEQMKKTLTKTLPHLTHISIQPTNLRE